LIERSHCDAPRDAITAEGLRIMAPGSRAELPHNPIRQYKPPLAERLVSLYDDEPPPPPPTRRQKIDATYAALNRERSIAEQEAAARERSAAAEEARLERALEHERRRTLAAKLALARSQRDLAARWAARLVLRHRAGDRRLGAWAIWKCEAARRAAIARALRRAGAITVKAAKRDAWMAWRRRATQRRASVHLARRFVTRTARRTFSRWRTASETAGVLRAAALAATSVTESTARRHAETIAELEAKLAAQVAKATFDAAQVADEEAALRAAESQEWERRVAAADAAAASERQRASEAEAARAEDRRVRDALRQTLEHRDAASTVDRERASDAAAAADAAFAAMSSARRAAIRRADAACTALREAKASAERRRDRRAAKAQSDALEMDRRDARVAARDAQLALDVAAARQNAVTERSKRAEADARADEASITARNAKRDALRLEEEIKVATDARENAEGRAARVEIQSAAVEAARDDAVARAVAAQAEVALARTAASKARLCAMRVATRAARDVDRATTAAAAAEATASSATARADGAEAARDVAQAEAARCRKADEAQRATVAAAEARSRDVVREAQEKLAAVEECVRDSRAERDAAVNAAQEERDAAVAAAQEERDEAVEEARRERDAAVSKARAELENLSDEAAEHHDRGAKALMRCAELDVALRESDAQRRQLHDALQTLKGGVRVCARLKPGAGAIRADGLDGVVVPAAVRTKVDGGAAPSVKPRRVRLDRVFGPEAAQTEVYAEVDALVRSALDGYDVCVLAYGATGAGKTHTMLGDEGIVPSAAKAIAAAARDRKRRGWSLDVRATAVEVYAEKCFDLLGNDREPLVLRDDGSVDGASVHTIGGDDELADLVRRASDARRTAATALNDRSSRSHALVRVELDGDDGQNRLTGSLTLVDLAGSERADRAGTAQPGSCDARLREACAINRSLLCLCDVFRALARRGAAPDRDVHIPYRNSVLTRLLQRPLSGTGKCLVVANVAPDQMPESGATLRFASDVAAIATKAPTKHVAKNVLRARSANVTRPRKRSTK
jgi:kinesin family protein C1